jgi:hypothetical protein
VERRKNKGVEKKMNVLRKEIKNLNYILRLLAFSDLRMVYLRVIIQYLTTNVKRII